MTIENDDNQELDQENPALAPAMEVDLPEDDDDDDDGPEQPQVRQPGEPQRPSKKERRRERMQKRIAEQAERLVEEKLRTLVPQFQQQYRPEPQQQAPAPRESPADDELTKVRTKAQRYLTKLADPKISDEDHAFFLGEYQEIQRREQELMAERYARPVPQGPNPLLEQLRYDYRDVLAKPGAEQTIAFSAQQKLAMNPALGKYGAIKEAFEEARAAAKALTSRPAPGVASRYGNASSGATSTAGGSRNTVKLTKAEVSMARSVYPDLPEAKAVAKWAAEQEKLKKNGRL